MYVYDTEIISQALAPGKGHSTSPSNIPSVRAVNKFLEVGVVEVLAETRLLLIEFGAA